MNTISIALLEKNKIYQEQLSLFLNSQNLLKVVSTADNCTDLLKEISTKAVDVVILNLSFPFFKILETTQEIRARFSEIIKIIVCNVPFEHTISERLKRIGVNTILNSNSTSKNLLDVLSKPQESSKSYSMTHTSNPTSILTRRELDICQQICFGKSCPQIAIDLHISIRTVENHKANIFRKFEVGSVTQMMEKAILYGYYYL